MTETQLQSPTTDSDRAFTANIDEFITLAKQLTKEKDATALNRGLIRLTQLNNELEAME